MRPRVPATRANAWLAARALSADDVPTLLRPQKANSGGPGGGHPRASLADFTNSAERTITHRLSLSHRETFGFRAARSAVQWSMRCIASFGSNGRSDGD